MLLATAMAIQPNVEQTSRSGVPATPQRWLVACPCILLAIGVAIVFAQTGHYKFVNLDDNIGVYDNPEVTAGLTGHGLRWAFNNQLNETFGPITWISHQAVWQVFGDSAGRHHLVNVVLHAATVVLLFLVLRKMTGRLWPSLLATTIWAIHPLRVESVAWVIERKDVLSGLFFMATLWAYADYTQRQSRHGRLLVYMGLMFVFALGLLSKPALVTLPCVMLLLDYWPLGRVLAASPLSNTQRPWLSDVLRVVVEKFPLLALSAGCCAATFWAERVADYPARGAWWRIGNGLIGYVVYLRQFFWPTDLALLYPRRPDFLPARQVLGTAAILLTITAVAVLLRRKCPYLLVGWLWYLGMLLPAVGFVAFGNEAPADRFTYLPQIGLCIALVWTVTDWCGSLVGRRALCAVGAAAAILVLAGCAWRQTHYWRNSETIWQRTLACIPDSREAHIMLGHDLAMRGETQKAIEHFKKAVEIGPDDQQAAQAYKALGVAERSLGNLDLAIEYYKKASVVENPFYAEAKNNLGDTLLMIGQPYEALKHLEDALRVRPDFAAAHYNMGVALHTLQHYPRAIDEYREAIRLMPDYANAHYNLAQALYFSGHRDEAIAHCREALRINPHFAEARRALDLMLKNAK